MNQSINFKKLDCVKELNPSELSEINGGGFWGDLFYAGAATVHFICYMLEDAHKNPIRPSEYR